jgi:magnesium transporter
LQIFNDSVDAYKSWTLFLIFVSIIVLISGVVLLTHKKPERTTPASTGRLGLAVRKYKHKAKQSDTKALVNRQVDGEEEGQSLRRSEEGNGETAEELWEVGEASDDEDEPNSSMRLQRTPTTASGEEGVGLMLRDHEEEDAHELVHERSRAGSTLSRRASDPFRDEPDGFGEFANGHANAAGGDR